MTFLKLILETNKWSFCLSSMPFQTKCVCTTSIQLRIWFSTIFGLLKFCNIYNIIRFCEEIPCRNLCNFVKVLIVMFRKSKITSVRGKFFIFYFLKTVRNYRQLRMNCCSNFSFRKIFKTEFRGPPTVHIASTQYAGEET